MELKKKKRDKRVNKFSMFADVPRKTLINVRSCFQKASRCKQADVSTEKFKPFLN